jgi:hypothetical protein
MFIPDKKDSTDLDPHKRIEVFLTQKIVYKLSEISSGMVIPDPDFEFLPIQDPGSRSQKGTGSRIRNTDSFGLTDYSTI